MERTSTLLIRLYHSALVSTCHNSVSPLCGVNQNVVLSAIPGLSCFYIYDALHRLETQTC